ncbi:hypothetical protein C1646_797671 [Rhizophagus diaphanus]|nr:hypothetical protein C1646_797671 [Rhizophagus diaphanus] [Rhizophagus sp. MUCL 43196]
MNQGVENTLTIFQQIICKLLNFKKINEEFTYNTNFNAETIKHEILNKLDYGSCGESSNIVILELGSNPNSDKKIFHVAEMYKKDFAMKSDSFLDIVADEAMSRKMAIYKTSFSERAIKSRQESLWKLVNDLVEIFEMDNSLSHQLFQKYKPTEIHQEGLDRLIAYYPNGLERIKGIYQQEVLKIENRNTKGRRAVEVLYA